MYWNLRNFLHVRTSIVCIWHYQLSTFIPATYIQVLDLWEKVTRFIEDREKLLSDLENFEREASDPTRFFSKGETI